MRERELAVAGAREFTPEVYRDHRGLFTSPFQTDAFEKALHAPLFPIRQMSCSQSAKNVLRGVHFSRHPFGTAKYVYCPRGSALDVVVDLRPGSPTYLRWDAVRLDAESFRAVYFPIGVGHAFLALEDGTVMQYLLSRSYVAENELAVHPLDDALGLPIPLPEAGDPVLSERDRNAPTLAEAERRGLLPPYEECLALERELYGI